MKRKSDWQMLPHESLHLAQRFARHPGRYGVSECRVWAARLRGRNGPVRYNATVGALRRVFGLAIEQHVRLDNPAIGIGKARVETRRANLWLPEPAQFTPLVNASAPAKGRGTLISCCS